MGKEGRRLFVGRLKVCSSGLISETYLGEPVGQEEGAVTIKNIGRIVEFQAPLFDKTGKQVPGFNVIPSLITDPTFTEATFSLDNFSATTYVEERESPALFTELDSKRQQQRMEDAGLATPPTTPPPNTPPHVV